MDVKVALAPIARINFDMELAEQVRLQLRTSLMYGGVRVVGGDDFIIDEDSAQVYIDGLKFQEHDVVLVFYATFADSKMINLIANQIDKPLFIWALPEEPNGDRLRLNSLCGVNLAAHAMTLQKIPYDYVYAKANEMKAVQKVKEIGMAGKIVAKLKQTRVGVVGEYPSGMDSCILDAPTLKEKLGVEVLEYDIEKIFEQIRVVEAEEIVPLRTRLDAKIDGLGDVDQDQVACSLGTYQVLKRLTKEDRLDGLAVRCWPEFFTNLKCSACGAISLLTDEFTPTSCEADINGTLTDLMLQWASGGTAFSTDIVVSDYENNGTILWHCGQAPLSMADPEVRPRATVHSNRKLALLMEFTLKPGPVTVARLSQATGELRLVLARGKMLKAPMSFSGTSGVIRFESSAEKVLDTILSQGLEHHVSLTYGDHLEVMVQVAKLLDVPVLYL